MKRARMLGLLIGAAATLCISCGGRTLERVEEIRLTDYPAGAPFRLTVVMEACSDSCATYEEPECGVDVNKEEHTIDISPSVCFERTTDECSERCGPEIRAHCQVPALSSGTYTVQFGSFSREITVQ